MRIARHVYSTHIHEDPKTFGAMHPGGTQIYFVGDPDGEMVIVDTGEPYRSWTRQILDYHAELGSPKISAILITHGHNDHIGGLDRLQDALACPVRCHPKLEPILTQRLGPGCVFPLRSRERATTGGGVSLRALYTPGHADDHVSYFMTSGRVLFTGDTILGNSSSSVRNLRQYMDSLDLLARQRPQLICPGHGQTVQNATARVNWYIHHRQRREEQVLAALDSGASTADEIVRRVYPGNLRSNLRAAAAHNVATHLAKLVEEGRVLQDAASYTLAG